MEGNPSATPNHLIKNILGRRPTRHKDTGRRRNDGERGGRKRGRKEGRRRERGGDEDASEFGSRPRKKRKQDAYQVAQECKRKRKKKKKENQFIRCELCHRDCDFNTNTLAYTVSQYLSTSHWVGVSG